MVRPQKKRVSWIPEENGMILKMKKEALLLLWEEMSLLHQFGQQRCHVMVDGLEFFVIGLLFIIQ